MDRFHNIFSLIQFLLRLLINAEGSVVLFQFEDIEWDHNQLSDKIPNQAVIGKFHDVPAQIKPPPYTKSVREKRARKKNWKLYKEVDDTVLSYYISQHATRLSKGVPGIYVRAGIIVYCMYASTVYQIGKKNPFCQQFCQSEQMVMDGLINRKCFLQINKIE